MADEHNGRNGRNGRFSPYTIVFVGAALTLIGGTLVASLTWWKDYAVRASMQDQHTRQIQTLEERLNTTLDLFHTMQQVDQEQTHNIRSIERQLGEDKRYLEEILRRIRTIEIGKFGLSEPAK